MENSSLSLSMGIFIVSIDLAIVNLALPYIASDFDVSLSSVKWVLTAYLISGGALVRVVCKLSDLIGAKKNMSVWNSSFYTGLLLLRYF